jgi:chemotaxis protein CheY-P-specific phosphatase CheC
MLSTYYNGVTIVDSHTQQNISWISDLVVKALCGACTILLGVAVNSLNSMNAEIKDLSRSVNALTVSSTVVIESQKAIELRLTKLENEDERIRNRLRDATVEMEVIKKSR